MGVYGPHGDKKLAYALKGEYKAQRSEQQGRIYMFLNVVDTVIKREVMRPSVENDLRSLGKGMNVN